MSNSENGKPKEEVEKEKKAEKAKKNDKDKPLKIKRQKPQVFDQPSYLVSSSPHVKNSDTIPKVMWTVFIVLLPAVLWGILHFAIGFTVQLEPFNIAYSKDLPDGVFLSIIMSKALHHVILAVITCMLTEALVNVIRKERLSAFDGSAAVTGILLAMTLPYDAPLFVSIISSIFAIAIVKHLFGGLGNNFMNPALAGRVFAMGAWPGIMYTQKLYLAVTDTSTGATTLELMKKFVKEVNPTEAATFKTKIASYSIADMAMGNIGGSLGEVSAVFLIIGAIYLFIKKYITWEIPFTYLATVFGFTLLLGGKGDYIGVNFAVYHLFAGGLILGSFYMATDMVTTPLTSKGQLIFGVGCGILTVLIRLYGGYPEGVAFSILLMNLCTPLIDRVTAPRIFGHFKKPKQKEA